MFRDESVWAEQLPGWSPAGGTHALAVFAFPGLDGWLPVLESLGFPLEKLLPFAAAAENNRWTIVEELLASGALAEERLFRAIACRLGLPFTPSPDPHALMIGEDALPVLLRGNLRDVPVRAEGSTLLLAPMRQSPEALRQRLDEAPALRARLHIATPTALRRALVTRAEPLLLRSAISGLADAHPMMSARRTLLPWQSLALVAALVLLTLALVFAPAASLVAIHCFATLFFFACVLLRLRAARSAPDYRLAAVSAKDEELPVYSVLVALHREAAVVPQLIASLEALDWPAGRLEIKLVCEADDHATLDAIRAAHPSPLFEVVTVPPAHPRTKPKALNYALPLTRGSLVVLFDAEDRPDPFQLREAWARFQAGGERLACLQAPLVIANDRASWPARLFAVEYAALFRGLLPYLAERGLVLPLGGTSNHFRGLM